MLGAPAQRRRAAAIIAYRQLHEAAATREAAPRHADDDKYVALYLKIAGILRLLGHMMTH